MKILLYILTLSTIICAQTSIKIKVDISHNILPPENLPTYKVTMISLKTGKTKVAQNGDFVKPGKYLLKIKQPGYKGIKKSIIIFSNNQSYYIKEYLVALPRRISFQISASIGGCLVPAHEIIEAKTGKPVSFRKKFSAGSQIKLIIKFGKRQTLKTQVKIRPGEGPMIIRVPELKWLKQYDFIMPEKGITLDGILYPYKFYVNGKQIEKHLISIDKGINRRYFSIKVPPATKLLTISSGYLLVKAPLANLKNIPQFNNISTLRLIKHLSAVSKKAALRRMENVLAKTALFKKLTKADIGQLIEFIKGWQLKDSKTRKRDVLKKLANLKK